MTEKPNHIATHETIITNMDIVSPIITHVNTNNAEIIKNKKVIKTIR